LEITSTAGDGRKNAGSIDPIRVAFAIMSPTEAPKKLRYEAVKELVISIIHDQKLVPGDRLPSSSELVETSGVSSISVRRALDELEREGRIRRHQGIGTFVAQPRIISEPSRLGDLLATLTAGSNEKAVTTELISLRVGMPGATIAQTLRISSGQPVWEVVRGRRVAGEPAIVERAILPLQVVPSLEESYLANGGSLYKFLAEKHGIIDHSEEQYLEVALPGALERNWLNLPARELAVTVKGVSFNQEGVPFDCFQQTYPAQRFVFYVSGSKEHQFLNSPDRDDWTVTSLTT